MRLVSFKTTIGTAPLSCYCMSSRGGGNISTSHRLYKTCSPPFSAKLSNLSVFSNSFFQRNYNIVAVSLAPASHQPITHYIGRDFTLPSVGIILSLTALSIMRTIEDLRGDLNDPICLGRRQGGCTCIWLRMRR
ncbi:hypothetical protein BDV11DRAFT_197748 [Aspergillus similis]